MVFAVIVAAVSIVFVVKARGNFASILDMQTRRTDANICSTYITQKHKRTTSVFQKIAIRCICYPLGKSLHNDHFKRANTFALLTIDQTICSAILLINSICFFLPLSFNYSAFDYQSLGYQFRVCYCFKYPYTISFIFLGSVIFWLTR